MAVKFGNSRRGQKSDLNDLTFGFVRVRFGVNNTII